MVWVAIRLTRRRDCPGGTPGLTTGTLHGKLGIRAGNTGLINLDDVRVPVEHRIGEEGEGFLVAMSTGPLVPATGRHGPVAHEPVTDARFRGMR